MIRDLFQRRGAIRNPAVIAWIIYDIGNTLFFTAVIGIFFPLWITEDMSGDDATVGYTLAAAMGLVLVLGPILGTFSDQARRRKPFLAVATLTCIAATLLIGGDNQILALSLYAVAVVAVGISVIFYNALLVEVSTDTNRGTVAGLGVGIGYLGAIIAVVMALVFVESRGYVFGFRATGVLILLISVPVLLLLKEQPRPTSANSTVLERTNGTFTQLRTTLGNIQQFPGLRQFLIARFWYTWAVQTAASFAILYGTETVDFTARQVEIVLLIGILVAIPSGLIWGIVVDRIGPNRVLSGVLVAWIIVFLAAAGIPWLDLPSYLWIGVGVVSGVVVAGVWVADRPYLLLLTSHEYLGEFFGIHAMMGKLSAMVGPFSWSFIAVTLGLGQTASVLSLAGTAVIALALIRGVSDRAQVRTPELDA